MKHSSKTTKRMISVFAQIVQRLPGHLIDQIADDQTVKARQFSYSSQLYTLMLGHFLHAFSLNELVDISTIHRAELSRIRGISPARRNTFSYANRTRDPIVAAAVGGSGTTDIVATDIVNCVTFAAVGW